MVLLRAGSSEVHSSWSKAEGTEDVHARPFIRQMELQQAWGDPHRRARLEKIEPCRHSLAWVIGRGGGTQRLQENPSLPQKTLAEKGKAEEARSKEETLWVQ